MKCRLCDRPTTPGTGKLCLDCTKALHRARASSPAARKLSMSPPVQAKAMATMGPPLTLATTSVLAPGWRRYSVWAAAGLVAIGIVYFTQSGPDHRRARDAVVADHAPASAVERSHVDAPAVSTPLEAPSSTAQAVGTEFPGATPAPQTKAELNVAKTSPSPGGAKTPPRAGTRSTNANRDPSSSSAAHAFAIDTATSKSNAPSQPETPQLPARASVPPSASPTEGAQTFASVLEKCGKEAFLSRFICEQKMYMQYCKDKWEKDPRCVRKTASN